MFGVVDKHYHFHPTGCLFANKVDTDSCAHLMSVLSEHVGNLFRTPTDAKNSLNDDDNAMLKGFKLVFSLDPPGNCCAHAVVMNMPKNGANTALMIQRTLGISTKI